MTEELAAVLQELGSEGITAFYVHLAVHEIAGWTVFLCIVWGLRTIWKWFKENHDDF